MQIKSIISFVMFEMISLYALPNMAKNVQCVSTHLMVVVSSTISLMGKELLLQYLLSTVNIPNIK